MEKEFRAFQKIPRYEGEMVITEKIDGTNGLVAIFEDGEVKAGSRNRWIKVGDDNFGFAKWVQEHEDELREGLGVGYHYGEWWGGSVQRGYGVKDKRFSLFNVARWGADQPNRIACCHGVPLLYEGQVSEAAIFSVLQDLEQHGSYAAPGFEKPEGIIVYHKKSRYTWKVYLNE
jgi:hypothetical protein